MLNIFEALENGFDRAYSREGLVLAAVFFVLTTLNTVISSSLARTPFDFYRDLGFALPFSSEVLLSGSFLIAILTAATTIAAMRVFVQDRELELEVFTDRMVYALVNILVGSILYGLVILTGFLFFIVPGLFLMAALLYWQYRVAVENENFIEALRGSWNLTSGSRLRVFGLLLATLLVVMAISFAFSIPMMFGLSVYGLLIGQAGNSFGVVVAVAVLANGYNQLKE